MALDFVRENCLIPLWADPGFHRCKVKKTREPGLLLTPPRDRSLDYGLSLAGVGVISRLEATPARLDRDLERLAARYGRS